MYVGRNNDLCVALRMIHLRLFVNREIVMAFFQLVSTLILLCLSIVIAISTLCVPANFIISQLAETFLFPSTYK